MNSLMNYFSTEKLISLFFSIFGVVGLVRREYWVKRIVESNKKFGGGSEANKPTRFLSVVIPIWFIVLGIADLFGWTHWNR